MSSFEWAKKERNKQTNKQTPVNNIGKLQSEVQVFS
jgi:hypothetical protein